MRRKQRGVNREYYISYLILLFPVLFCINLLSVLHFVSSANQLAASPHVLSPVSCSACIEVLSFPLRLSRRSSSSSPPCPLYESMFWFVSSPCCFCFSCLAHFVLFCQNKYVAHHHLPAFFLLFSVSSPHPGHCQ